MDSDCLIKLTKAGLKEEVCAAFAIAIPKDVQREVVEEGRGHPDAAKVKKNLDLGLVHVHESGSTDQEGETAALAAYRDGAYDVIASDDRRFVRRLLAQNVPFVTPGVLVFLLAKRGRLSREDAYHALRNLSPFISEEELAVVRSSLGSLGVGGGT